MWCKSHALITGIEHHKLGGKKDVPKDVEALSHIRLDASKTICSKGDLSVFLILQTYTRARFIKGVCTYILVDLSPGHS